MMGTPDKDRQAAYKTRMRESGKRDRTFWVSSEQEDFIKAYLAGAALPVTGSHGQEALQARMAGLEAEVASLTQQLAEANDLALKAAQKSERLSKELKAAKKTTPKGVGFDLSAPRADERAKVLLAQIDKMTTWQGDQKSRDAHGTRQEVEHLATLVRQTKAARTAIAKAETELANVVTDGEKEVLTYARMALSQILDAAEIAKDRGRGVAKKREAHELACQTAAKNAVAEAFRPESIEDEIVLVMAPGKPASYTDAADLLNGKAFERTWRDDRGKEHPRDALGAAIARAVRDATGELVYAVCRAIKTPAEAVTKAQEIKAEMESRRPALLAEHAELIRRIKAELVLRRMEKAAAPEANP